MMLGTARPEDRQHIFADRFAREALEGGHFAKSPRPEAADRRDAAAAEENGCMKPYQPVDELCMQKCRGEPPAALDEKPGEALLAEKTKGAGEVDLPGGIGRGGEDEDASRAQRLLAGLVGGGQRYQPSRGLARRGKDPGARGHPQLAV